MLRLLIVPAFAMFYFGVRLLFWTALQGFRAGVWAFNRWQTWYFARKGVRARSMLSEDLSSPPVVKHGPVRSRTVPAVLPRSAVRQVQVRGTDWVDT